MKYEKKKKKEEKRRNKEEKRKRSLKALFSSFIPHPLSRVGDDN
jgi:hypothetical protein